MARRKKSGPPAIEAKGLVKRYGKVEALAGLDIVAEPGQVLAVLGPNGAGKTTFVRSVATLIRPEAGSLHVAGIDVLAKPEAVRRLIGLAGQFAAVEPTMTGRENLEMVARLFGSSKSDAKADSAKVLTTLGLDEAGDRLVRTYSGGMRRKLDLGASLVGSPRLLLLDEPTTGLDPRSRLDLWDTIRELVGRGTDVLLTTQYLDEADALANQIVIIDHGRAIAQGTPAALKRQSGRDVLEVAVRDKKHMTKVTALLKRLGAGEPHRDEEARRVTVAVDSGVDRLMTGLRSLGRSGITLEEVALRRPKLDEVFMELTGAPLSANGSAANEGDKS